MENTRDAHDQSRLPRAYLLELTRWNTPSIYNGWEQVTRHNPGRECFNLEETRDFMPQMGPMAGYAVTLQIQPGNPAHRRGNLQAWAEYRRYVASVPGPKIVVIQDLDKPALYGSFWGEVNSSVHRALGCVGTITDGGIRDLDEMTAAGFKALARRLCVGHAFNYPVAWNCEVEVFGVRVQPGQLIHADKHGFLALPREDEAAVLEAARFMDSNECHTVIAAARGSTGRTMEDAVETINRASGAFREATRARFGAPGEW